ncbi:MAG: type IV pilus assembly protein PilM, partial [Candidatus Omnitrophica bacterium]|nr:type IV pilus assembly protein PilM [Candidatus Omnitrophota bacterium]
VLIAVAKKELINQRIKLIEDAGLSADIVDIDSLALTNAFNFNYSEDDSLKNKVMALLNIGYSVTNLSILENGIPHLSRDIHIAGNNFTQKLVDTFGVDFKSAEELKLNPDDQKAAKVTEAFESVVTSLIGEIRISFDYYESQSASSVAKIFLSGGGSKIVGLKDMLGNLLGIEVEYWDPLKKIILSNEVDSQKIKTLFSQFAVAIGLALRSS